MKKFFASLLFLCGLLSAVAWGQSGNLPELGDASGGLLTPSEELELGRSLLREIRRVMPLVDDPEVAFYVEALGRRMVSNAPDASGTFHFLTIDNDQVNAFAMPGGIVGVHTGLIVAARDEAELAAVIGHEIAHITQRHIARMYARGRDINFATGLAILAGILAAGIDPQLGQAAIASGMAFGMQSQIDYTRSNEAEADRVGIQILTSAGFDPHAMADFFERMQELTRGAQDAVPEYLRTHPVTLGRISDARGRAEQMPGDFTRDDTRLFDWMQARVRALSDPRRSVQDHEARRDHSPVQLYEAAVGHLELGQTAAAEQLLARIPAGEAPTLVLALAEAALLGRQGRLGQAQELLEQLSSVYPGHPVIRYLQARNHHAAGRHGEAVRMVEQILHRQATPDPHLLRLKADAADADGRVAVSRETMAEYFFHRGQYTEAVRQFDDALLAPDATPRDVERIEHKRDTASQVARQDAR
ncbi:M48 family metalloprotease [Thioalkalivibrio sp.]|uniref:M48 family metalloprotease n=1 Tax=Thioalkalivibrio sp. TaxID=2093813 RepID=UPI003977217D